MAANNKELIARSFKTVLEMLADRKIDVSGISTDGISELTSNNNLFEVKINDKIKIVYFLFNKFKWVELKPFLKDNMELYIIITKEKISQNNVNYINQEKIPYQLFTIKELVINITKHVLVPKHELISSAEVDEIVQKYHLKSKYQLYTILKTDPMARYLNLKNGDVAKVTRKSQSSGEHVVYRCCV